ncbi:hypothetical protein [Marinobacter sp.]|uniref:hypothetical protein n=1 Tax=Marinobacter sp. TaxID=50741 RepID=UPI003A902F31
MMIGIVIPLKAKSVSRNWDVTLKNLAMTLKSIDSQTCDFFEAIVIGHDLPEYFDQSDSCFNKVKFLHFNDFAPPQKGSDEAQNQLNYEKDRCSKILKGIQILKKHHSGITHWFALDADDLIHKNFVKVLQKYGPKENIVLDKGYFYYKSTGLINKEDSFSSYCGSSSVLSDYFFDIPSEEKVVDFRSIPFGSVSHVHMRDYVIREGHSVKIPAERLIMYVRDNGENISSGVYCNTAYKKFKKYIKVLFKYKFFGKSLKADFGII